MIRRLMFKYKQIHKQIEIKDWLKKKKKIKRKLGYNINKFLILQWILGKLIIKGHKEWSFNILVTLLLKMKKKCKLKPYKFLSVLLNRKKQRILLFNKRRGSLVYELPRFISLQQGIKKIIEWLIKTARKNKESINTSLIKEFRNLRKNKGEIKKKKKYISDTLIKNKPFFYILRRKKRK